MRRRRDPAASGYTLIEIVVVLAILSLAIAVVLPAIGRGAEGLRARAEVAGLAAFLRSAREQAIVRQQPYVVALEPEVRVVRLGPAGPDSVGLVEASRRLSPLLRVGGPAVTRRVTFLPQGTSSGARLELYAPGPRVYVITVDTLTGRVATQRQDS